MDSNVVVVKKKHTFLKVVGVLLAVGAACVVAAKLYQKFAKKKAEALPADTEEEALEIEGCCEEEAPTAEEEPFEVSAEAVIANAEDMEEPANE